MTINTHWDSEGWMIATQAWEGENLLRELPQRSAINLEDCVQQIRAAMSGLRSFEDLFAG